MGQTWAVHNKAAVLHNWFKNLSHLIQILHSAHITKSVIVFV